MVRLTRFSGLVCTTDELSPIAKFSIGDVFEMAVNKNTLVVIKKITTYDVEFIYVPLGNRQVTSILSIEKTNAKIENNLWVKI